MVIKYYYHQWINKLFLENRIPEHCLKLDRWQGPPHVNKGKQYEIVLSVFLYISFSHENDEDEEICLKNRSPKRQSAP